jgi:DNA-binding IclR family transcriptional regulator
VTPEQVLNTFAEAEVPVLTSSEVADEIECSREAAYNKLETLVEQDYIYKKKVGSRAVVYIQLGQI